MSIVGKNNSEIKYCPACGNGVNLSTSNFCGLCGLCFRNKCKVCSVEGFWYYCILCGTKMTPIQSSFGLNLVCQRSMNQPTETEETTQVSVVKICFRLMSNKNFVMKKNYFLLRRLLTSVVKKKTNKRLK